MVDLPDPLEGGPAVYLQENMTVKLALFDGVAVSAELPQRVTLEITETEPVTKGQTVPLL